VLIDRLDAAEPAQPAASSETTIHGRITDEFDEPPPVKKQPPHRRQDRTPGVAFEEAQKRTDSKENGKR